MKVWRRHLPCPSSQYHTTQHPPPSSLQGRSSSWFSSSSRSSQSETSRAPCSCCLADPSRCSTRFGGPTLSRRSYGRRSPCKWRGVIATLTPAGEGGDTRGLFRPRELYPTPTPSLHYSDTAITMPRTYKSKPLVLKAACCGGLSIPACRNGAPLSPTSGKSDGVSNSTSFSALCLLSSTSWPMAR